MSDEERVKEAVLTAAQQAIEEKARQDEAARQAEEDAKKPKLRADLDYSFLATKEEMNAELEKIRTENKELKDLLLRAKAQGKAHVEEQKLKENEEIKQIYGDFLKFKP